jgi:hypothetical protein
MAEGLVATERLRPWAMLSRSNEVERCSTSPIEKEGASAWWADRRWQINRRDVLSDRLAPGIEEILVEAATFGLVAEPPHTCMFITSL